MLLKICARPAGTATPFVDSTAICGFITTWLASVQNGGTVVADFKVSAFPTAWLAAVVAPAAG